MQYIRTFITNLLSLVGTFASLILSRWLLELSSPSRDWIWLQQQPAFWYVWRLRWYRGAEFFHQLRARKLLASL